MNFKFKSYSVSQPRKFFIVLNIFFLYLFWATSAVSQEANHMILAKAVKKNNKDYQEYLKFFDQVYDTMDKNYYKPVSRQALTKFIKVFDSKIYSQLQSEGKSINYIKWRSAAYLIDYLKDTEDIFSAFFPPKPAKEFENKVLGKEISLGIEGHLIAQGYIVLMVEPRSDSYIKGLRPKDIIQKIDDISVIIFNEDQIKKKLTPLEGAKVILDFFDESGTEKKIEVISQEFFEQTVFMEPVDVPGIHCLEIRKFNQKTSEDMFNYLNFIKTQEKDLGLILDLRGNPGGPPLAAREISSFFLPPGEDFAYFQKRGQPKSLLNVPAIPSKYHYQNPIVILVNKDSGSASELFSGVMQKRKRSFLMGTNTAGKVFLKSMFYFDDESMVLLVTARGYYPDGSVFSFDGVVPDQVVKVSEKNELIHLAAEYLIAQLTKK